MTLRDGPPPTGALPPVAAALLALCACRGGATAPPCEEPPRVQVLMQTSDRANVGENGQSWPTKLVVYQLTGTSSLDQLDLETLKEQGEKLFGDEYLDKRELTAFPKTYEREEIALKPKVTHLLVVAQFRESLGTAWYATYTVPSNMRDAQCEAQQQQEPPPVPCVYVAIEGSEMAGGGYKPPNWQSSEFTAVCGTIAPPKVKKKKKKKVPDVPDVPPQPKTPTTPSTPSAPSAPSAPTAPKAPGR